MSFSTLPERFVKSWDEQHHKSLQARSRGDHLSLKEAFAELCSLAFQADSDEPLERLLSMGWTPWMQEPQRFFPLFHGNMDRALLLFERFPEYAGWFPLNEFLISRHDGARKAPEGRLASLNRFAQSAGFARQPFRPVAQEAQKLLSPMASHAFSHPAAEAFLSLEAWSRASRSEALAFCSALLKPVSSQAAAPLLACAAKALLRSNGPAAMDQGKQARDMLERLAEAGRSADIAALGAADPVFQQELTRPGPLLSIRRQHEVADGSMPFIQSHLAGRALLGSSPESAKALLDLGAPKASMEYWRDENLTAPETILQELKAGGKDGAKAARKIARARALLPRAIAIDPEQREALLRALDGERNAVSGKNTVLRIGHQASLPELALVALLTERPRSMEPRQTNWAAIGPALNAILEPGERLPDVVAKALSLIRASSHPLSQLPDEFKAYLEGVEIMEASRGARPQAANDSPGRFKL